MVNFDEKTHTYTNEDGRTLISVTTLLKKYGLAPDYSGVPEEILMKKAERGTMVHEEIEDYIKNNVIGFSAELSSFIKYTIDNNIKIIKSEEVVNNDIVAGKFDLLCMRDGKLIRVDYKTTSSVHRQECSWQLSCYDYLDSIKADALEVWHFSEDGKMKIIAVPFVKTEFIENMFASERSGGLVEFNAPTVTVTDTQLEIIEEATRIIERAKRDADEAKKRLEDVNAAIMKAMTENCVKTFENDVVKITLVDAYTKSAIDTTKLKKEMPDIAEKYTRVSEVKASLKITLKEEDNE